MDPITVSASILAIVQITNDATKLFKRIQTLDDRKLRILYFKLMGEKTITTTWANRMRLMNGNDLQRAVPPENFHDVTVIIKKLSQMFAEANSRINSVIALSDEKLKPSNLRQRFLWVSGGYEQLKETIELLETLNRTLGIKAPGLPPYSPPDREIVVGSPHAIVEATTASSVPSTTLAPESTDSDPNRKQEAPRTTLRTIYQLCLRCLRVIEGHVTSQTAGNVSSRLEMCGVGLFGEPYPLDEILERHRKRLDPLREHVLRTFVDIAVTEEGILKRLVQEKEEVERTRLEETRMQLTGFLGTDEMFPIALEKWQDSLEGLEEDDSLIEEVNFIGEVVETLYDLLPSARSMRREYVLFLEALERPAAKMEATKSDPSMAQVDAAELIASNLERAKQIESVLKVRETNASASGQRSLVPLYSPLFRKERERLEELRFDASEDQLLAGRLNKSGQVEKMQDILAKTLEACNTPVIPIADSKTDPDSRMAQKGVSMDVGEESLRQALEVFGLANSHLFSAAQG